MAYKLYTMLAVVALGTTLIGANGPGLQESELALIRQLFDSQAPALQPLKVQELLHQLEELYVNQKDYDTVDGSAKSRRMVVFTVAAHGEVSPENCNATYFDGFQRLINHVSDIPNIKSYLLYFMDAQLKTCKAQNPNFTFTQIK